MFATYSLNIHRLLTQNIHRRPNMHVNISRTFREYWSAIYGYVYGIIAEYLLAICENSSQQCIFSVGDMNLHAPKQGKVKLASVCLQRFSSIVVQRCLIIGLYYFSLKQVYNGKCITAVSADRGSL